MTIQEATEELKRRGLRNVRYSGRRKRLVLMCGDCDEIADSFGIHDKEDGTFVFFIHDENGAPESLEVFDSEDKASRALIRNAECLKRTEMRERYGFLGY